MIKQICYIFFLALYSLACKKVTGKEGFNPTPSVTLSTTTITTDKAVYNPADNITFTLAKAAPSGTHVRYKNLNEILGDETISGTSWTWKAPVSDFTGYLAELYTLKNNEETILGTIGIDVSSRWTKFPRYGFLSKYGQMNDAEVKSVIDNLNRFHINGIQFYDWHYKHHQPLAGTPQSPTPVYRDIFNRDIYFATVSKYVDAAHGRNMKAMFYNLVYGAWSGANNDGVKEEWYVYNDPNRAAKDKHPLPQPPFLSDLFLVNPANSAWQNYLIKENKKVYEALPFDGFHMDQLGERGTRYTYNGTPLNLAQTFTPFINAIDADMPQKYNVLNAVNQYGQEGIAQAATDFLYSEVWNPNNSYMDLARIIKDNNAFSNNTKNTVLAAYMNYDLANNMGFFNTPGVLMTNAVIFAFGGSHLEMGEHMLAKEYFPNSNLQMKGDLFAAMVSYYDFLVAYQNLLRDGGTFNTFPLTSADYKLRLNNWPPATGEVSIVGKQVGNKQVLHLLNYVNANTLEWRDNNGTQVTPAVIRNAKLSFITGKQVKKIWFASPDVDNGVSKQLSFTTSGNEITFNLPKLQYWDMVVVEYQ